MSEILNKISDYKNKILDHILLELYKKDLADGNLQRLYSLNEIFADQYNSQDYYVDILSREGYVIASYQGHQIEIVKLHLMGNDSVKHHRIHNRTYR